MRLTASALMTALFCVPGLVEAEPLHLVCVGGGVSQKQAGRTMQAYDSNGNAVFGHERRDIAVPYDGEAVIDIADDNTGSIRLPRTILPTIHGGKDGAFRIENLTRTDMEIAGSVKINFINSPHLQIDRVTGHIAIDGRNGSFSGECKAVDPTKAERRF